MCSGLQDVKANIKPQQNNGSLYVPEWLGIRKFSEDDCEILFYFSTVTSVNKFSEITKEKIDFFSKHTNYDTSYKLLKVLGLYGVKFFNRAAIHSPIISEKPLLLETKNVKNYKIQLIKFGSCLLDFNVRRQTIDRIIDFLRKTEFEYSHQLNGIRLDTLALKTDLNIDLINEVLSSANFNIINSQDEISAFYNDKPLEIEIDKGNIEIHSVELKEEQHEVINYDKKEISSNNNLFNDDSLSMVQLETDNNNLDISSNDDLTSVYLSVRAKNILNRYGIKTISQLITLTDEKILGFRNCGVTTLKEINNVVKKIRFMDTNLDKRKNIFIPVNYEISTTTENFEFDSKFQELNLNSEIKDLQLSVRAYNVLSHNGIDVIKQLINLKDEELLNFKNCGVTTLQEIKNAIQKFSFKIELNEKFFYVIKEKFLLSNNTLTFLDKLKLCKVWELLEVPYNIIIKPLIRLPEQKILVFKNYILNALIDIKNITGRMKLFDVLSVLPLSKRAYNVLSQNDINTINQLVNLTDEEILSFRNSGLGTLQEIKEVIKKISSITNLDENIFYIIIIGKDLSGDIFQILNDKLETTNEIELLELSEDSILINFNSLIAIWKELDKVLDELGCPKHPIKFTAKQLEELNKPTIEDILINTNLLEKIVSIPKYIDNIVSNFDVRNRVIYQERIRPIEKTTLEELGKKFNITRERIRQIEKKLIKKLTHPSLLSKYFKDINKLITYLFDVYGNIVHFNLFHNSIIVDSLIDDDKNIISFLLENFHSRNFDIEWNLNFLFNTHILNVKDIIEKIVVNLQDSLEIDIYSVNYDKVYQAVINEFYSFMYKENSEQESNFNSIINEITSYIINNYLEVKDDRVYGLSKKKSSVYDYAAYKFGELFPEGAYVYKDGEKVMEVLSQFLPELKERSSRAVITRIIARNDDVLLWGPGFYIHRSNINPDWQLVNWSVECSIELFNEGITEFKINKIFSEKEEIFKQGGIPTTQALYSLLRLPAYFEINIKNISLLKTYLTNKKLKIIKELIKRKFSKEELAINLRKLSFNNDEVKIILNYSKVLRSERLVLEEYPRVCDVKVGKVKKTFSEIINNYFIEKKDFVSLENLKEFFCFERGWKEYELYQVLDRLNEIIPTERGYIHLNYFNYDVEKLNTIIKKIEEKLSSINSVIHLRKIKEECNVSWIDVCSYDIRPETMGILLAKTENKNFRIEKRIYVIPCYSELPEDINLVKILSELLLEREDFVSVSEIQNYFKERGFTIPSLNDLIKKAGILKYCKYNYIHPETIGLNDNILEEVGQIIEEAFLFSEGKGIPYTNFSWIMDNLYEKLPPLQNEIEWNKDLLSSVTDKIDTVMVFNGVYVLYRNKFDIEDFGDLLGFIIADKYKDGICKVSTLEKELKSLEIIPIDNSLLYYKSQFLFNGSSVELVDEQNNIMLSKIGRDKYLKYEYV